jgi:hypothetical protein
MEWFEYFSAKFASNNERVFSYLNGITGENRMGCDSQHFPRHSICQLKFFDNKHMA